MAQSRSSPPWSDLQPELVGLVFLRLPTRADRARFPVICRQWASAARQCRLPPPSPMPWLVLPGGSVINFPHGEVFHLPVGTRFRSSCGEWILLSRDDDSCFLMNPFTRATMPVPSLSSYSPLDEHVETVNVDQMASGRVMPGTWMDCKDRDEISVNALVVCSNHLIAALATVGDGNLSTIALC
uniref:KIB1-4 beta-propeller domain-containing protein n=1 Tax=Arundo donax TaxID=35708 RepID=A0A0A9DBT8_ARUDO